MPKNRFILHKKLKRRSLIYPSPSVTLWDFFNFYKKNKGLTFSLFLIIPTISWISPLLFVAVARRTKNMQVDTPITPIATKLVNWLTNKLLKHDPGQ